MAAGWTLVAMQVSALALDAPLLALTARWPRRELISGSMAVVGLTCAVAAAAPSYAALLVALSFYGLALGMATGTSQAALMDMAGGDSPAPGGRQGPARDPRPADQAQRERMISRWSLLGAIGDVGAPLLVGGLALVGAGWRVAMALLAVLAVAHAALIARGPSLQAVPDGDEENGAENGARAGSLRTAILWCCAGVLCALLDEILVAFGALRLDQLGATPLQRGLVLVAWVVGQIAGLAASEWVWSRIHPLRLMMLCSAGCAVAYAAWLGVSWLPGSALLLLLSGFFGSALFPVVTAQAYAALPGRSTTVSAIAAVTAVGELLMPVLIGLAADHWGLRTALALLLLEPVGLGIVAAAVLARGRGSGRRA